MRTGDASAMMRKATRPKSPFQRLLDQRRNRPVYRPSRPKTPTAAPDDEAQSTNGAAADPEEVLVAM
jgi:hypothetical protein